MNKTKLFVTHPSCRRAEVKDSLAEEFIITQIEGSGGIQAFGGGAVSSFERLELA